MNKSILMVAGCGIVACVGMTLMMGHLLGVARDKHQKGSISATFSDRFMSKLERSSNLKIKRLGPKAEKGKRNSGIHVTAVVYPKVTTEMEDLVPQMGSLLWKSKFKAGKVRKVTVKWQEPVSQVWRQKEIPPPQNMLPLQLLKKGSARRKRAALRVNRTRGKAKTKPEKSMPAAKPGSTKTKPSTKPSTKTKN